MVEGNGLFGTNERCVHCKIDRELRDENREEGGYDSEFESVQEGKSNKANVLMHPPILSWYILHVLNRIYDFVDKFQRDSWDNAFCLGKGPLQCTESDPRFLR